MRMMHKTTITSLLLLVVLVGTCAASTIRSWSTVMGGPQQNYNIKDWQNTASAWQTSLGSSMYPVISAVPTSNNQLYVWTSDLVDVDLVAETTTTPVNGNGYVNLLDSVMFGTTLFTLYSTSVSAFDTTSHQFTWARSGSFPSMAVCQITSSTNWVVLMHGSMVVVLDAATGTQLSSLSAGAVCKLSCDVPNSGGFLCTTPTALMRYSPNLGFTPLINFQSGESPITLPSVASNGAIVIASTYTVYSVPSSTSTCTTGACSNICNTGAAYCWTVKNHALMSAQIALDDSNGLLFVISSSPSRLECWNAKTGALVSSVSGLSGPISVNINKLTVVVSSDHDITPVSYSTAGVLTPRTPSLLYSSFYVRVFSSPSGYAIVSSAPTCNQVMFVSDIPRLFDASACNPPSHGTAPWIIALAVVLPTLFCCCLICCCIKRRKNSDMPGHAILAEGVPLGFVTGNSL